VNTPFHIFPLTEKGLAPFLKNPTPPHRHDHQEIIFITAGKAKHLIDGEGLTIHAPVLLLVAEGKVHSFLPELHTKGWVIRFTNEFLPLEATDLFSQFLQLSAIPLRNIGFRQKVETLCRLLFKQNRESTAGGKAALRYLLSALLVLLKDEKEILITRGSAGKSLHYQTFNRFSELLERNYKNEKSVRFYANRLHLTPRKLGEICKEILGETTAPIIEKRVLIEAKRLLLHSERTVQEIAFELGFEEHSYFTKVFRKKIGLPPSEFREKHRAA